MARKGTKRARRSGRKGTRRQRGGVVGAVRNFFGQLCPGGRCRRAQHPPLQNGILNKNYILKSARKQFDALSDSEKVSTYLWLEQQPDLLEMMFPSTPMPETTFVEPNNITRGRSMASSRRFRSSSPRTNEEAKAMKHRERESAIEMAKRRKDAEAAFAAAVEERKQEARKRFAEHLKSEEARKQFWRRVSNLAATHLRGSPELPNISNTETWKQLAQLPHRGKELVNSSLLRGY